MCRENIFQKKAQGICTIEKNGIPLHTQSGELIAANDDSLAQLVEHNTFNVGVLGSSPKRITKEEDAQETHPFLFLSLPSERHPIPHAA